MLVQMTQRNAFTLCLSAGKAFACCVKQIPEDQSDGCRCPDYMKQIRNADSMRITDIR